jgi:Tol biopolymer transport system component
MLWIKQQRNYMEVKINKIVPLFLLIINSSLIFNSNIAASSSNEPFKFSGNIVFTIGQEKKNIDHIYLLNGTDRKLTKLTQKGINLWPRWSPDGKNIVFVSIRDDHKNYEIYMMDADGKNQRRITKTLGGNSTDPRWDSSGKRIFFRRTIKGNKQENILDLTTFKIQTLNNTDKLPEVKPIKDMKVYVEELYKKGEKEREKELARVKQEEKELQKVIQQIRNMYEYIPSPDGRYHALYYNMPKKIVLLDIKKNELKEIKSQRSGTPAWSKDSKKLAYVNDENGDHFEIFDIDKNQYMQIKINKTKDEGCGAELSWSRDSKKIVYTCGTDYIADSSQMYILDLETKKAEKIIKGNSPDWY